jgi:hypothetical protein
LKTKSIFIAISLVAASLFSAVPAHATIVKSTLTLSVPAGLAVGVSNPIDVSVCSLASASSKTCEVTDDRNVSLLVDGKMLASVTSHSGVASFFWSPSKAGQVKLQAKVAAKGTLKALVSETKSFPVGKKLPVTTVSTTYCSQDGCGDGAPDSLTFDDSSASISVLTGSSSTIGKGRTATLQYVGGSNLWTSQETGKTTWNADANSYGYAFSLTEDSSKYCVQGDETYLWTYRVLVSSTSKAAAAVSDTFDISYDCSGGSSNSSIGATVTYSDQSVDSSIYSADDISVSVTDPDSVGWTATSYYCESACTLDKNWNEIDSYTSSGDEDFTLLGDWGNGIGSYKVRVDIVPDDGSSTIESDVYQVDIY